jgi:LuxR family maltose regulon positive regulatory protein
MDATSYANKIVSPVLPPTVLHRPSLVSALDEAIIGIAPEGAGTPHSYKLILLCAPAGYGKTTLLADFARHTALPCCWCILDRADTDKIRLLELLICSIRQRFPHFGTALDALLAHTGAAMANESAQWYLLEIFLDAFIATLSQELSDRFALIICNYHEINDDQTINRLLNRLLQNLPSHCVLVIESRSMPDLELAPMLARREIFGLGSNELGFNEEEICRLAQLQGTSSLSLAEARRLAHSFGGWITGILLSTHLGDLRIPQFISSGWGSPAMRMEREHIFDYLVNEVFARESDAFAFLNEAIVLRHMTPKLCDALLSIADADVRLAHLEQQGLFVTRSGEGETERYLCHPVLRELLYEKLRIFAPERFTALHRRAMDLFRASQDYEQAIYHALAIPAYEVAADLIEQCYRQMFVQKYSSMLADWIDAFPEDILLQHPQLLLIRANIFLTAGEYTQAIPLLDAANAAIKSDEDTASTLLAEILVARSMILFQHCAYAEAQDVSRQALNLLPTEEKALRVEVYLRLGVCECMLCNFTSGIVEFRQALQLCGSEVETRQTARLHAALANAYDMVGLHTLSEHHRTCAIRCWEHLNDEWGKIDSLIGLGWTKQRQENYAEAEQILTRALQLARGDINYRLGEAYVLINLGEVFLDQQYYQQALTALEDGLAIARQMEDGYLMHCALCALAMIYLLMGDSHTPWLLLSQLDQVPSLNKQPRTYESMLRELTEGTILLWQQHYEEAYERLTQIEKALRAAGLKRDQLQVTIRRAACLHAQGKMDAMIGCLKEAVAIVRQCGYEILCSVETRRYPDMRQTLQTLPEAAHFHQLLWGETETDREHHSSALKTNITDLEPSPTPNIYHLKNIHSLPSLRILALGEPLVYLNGNLVKRWRMTRVMELFFFLLHIDRPIHKEQIMVALWPDADDPADQALRSSIYHLRKLLGFSCVVTHGGTYKLDLASIFENRIWYDVEIFRKRYEAAKAALVANDDVAARSAFQEMTSLYRDNYVSSIYSDWCSPYRNNLKYAYIDAHLQLAQIAWRNLQIDECITHWQHLLAVDSCLEEAHYGLMSCYLQQGKRGLALRQYQRCVEALNNELSVTPGPAIQNLYAGLINPSVEKKD